MTNTEGAQITYDLDALIEEARELGRDNGKAAGTWVFDGNTPDEARLLALKLDEDGDPAFEEHFGAPDPLSGEWADDLTPDGLLDELDVLREDVETGAVADAARDEICSAYEDAFREAHRDEVLRSASAGLS